MQQKFISPSCHVPLQIAKGSSWAANNLEPFSHHDRGNDMANHRPALKASNQTSLFLISWTKASHMTTANHKGGEKCNPEMCIKGEPELLGKSTSNLIIVIFFLNLSVTRQEDNKR